ncbi:MAG: cyclopropane-fatty-acyl-phospholipid synthase family protein, partial [Pseudomonadota bacterium]
MAKPSEPSQQTDRKAHAIRMIADEIAKTAPLDLSVRDWTGMRHPLCGEPSDDLAIEIGDPGVLASLLRRPTLDRLIQHYAHGNIALTGGTIIDLGRRVDDRETRRALKRLPKAKLAKQLLPFLTAPALKPGESRAFAGDESGEARKQSDNRGYIQFHYDVGNDFYRLFLDTELQYSCAYFTDWDNTLEQAQQDKIDMICRKLRLQPGDRMLDIGCGWGGLICHAAKHYGVQAHGITLSDEQLARVTERAIEEGLQDQVTVEIRDYADLSGTYNKIASVGMYEHVGLANIDTYFASVRRVLTPDGIFLNHAISRKAKRKRRRFSTRAEQRALQKYIFPGGELDDIGHTVAAMERAGFEVHDVEGWRQHYARTCEIWCERLTARRDEAVAHVGEETYRIWVAYLGGCSLAFARGTARIFQTLAT